MPAKRLRARTAKPNARRDLRGLLRIVREFGTPAAAPKPELLERLERAVLATPEEVLELHEAACFLRAYPDSPAVLACVERILEGFAARADLRRQRAALASTGIAGTDMHFAYYWFTARRLARRWPALLTIEWSEFEHADQLEELLPWLLLEHEELAFDEEHHAAPELALRERIAGLQGRSETDAAFLVDAFQALEAAPLLREKLFDELVVPLILAAGPDTPSRTRAALPVRRVAFQTTPLARTGRPPKRAFREAPASVRRPSLKESQRIVELARESMMTRQRDLYAFIHADPRDVLLVDYGAGLQFACLGLPPERRSLLCAMYVIIALKNGVPVCYLQATSLCASAEVNFNVFDTFRGAEASRILVAGLAMMHHVFGAETFAINTQQLGEGNPEALATGAWWFYHKHGFRPDGAGLRALAERELAARRRDPAKRSSIATLRELATEPLFLSLGRQRSDAVGRLNLQRVSANTSARVAQRIDCPRAQLERRCRDAAAERCGVRDTRAWKRPERLAWTRWAPLLVALPGIESWSAAERRALVRIVRAKAGRSELDFVRMFDAHAPLRRAVRALAR